MSETESTIGVVDGPAKDPTAERARATAGALASAPAFEPAMVPANELLPADFGAKLRAAREAAGLSVATMATRMRLHVKQVEALERCDLAALPALIYARGFVRSYARELKIDPLPLLEDLDRRAGVQTGAPPAPAPNAFRATRFGDGSRPIIVVALVLLLVAGLVGIWMPRLANTVAVAPTNAPAAPQVLAGAGVDKPGAGAEALAPTVEGGASAEPPKLAAAQAPAVHPVAKPPAASARASAPPAVPEEPAPLVLEAVPAPASAPAVDPNNLVLHVHATSWVEVHQANGTVVFSQICLAGSEHTIHGAPPLSVVIGNASSVDAQFHGATVDLVRYANANGVARFTLQ